jgi:hypothetical protein
MPVIKLKIKVSLVQLKLLKMMVASGDGQSVESIIEAWTSTEIRRLRAEGKLGQEAEIVQLENTEQNVPARKPEPMSQSH